MRLKVGIYDIVILQYQSKIIMTIKTRIETIQHLIQQAETSSHRPLNSVRLLAVSKQHSSDAITEAFNAGLRDFGENYLQEALTKIHALMHLPIDWHFIGSIQRNKTTAIAQHFNWVHTVSSLMIAERLNHARSDELPTLNICIQLNVDDEITKSGIHFDDALTLAAHVATLPRLALRGLMVIPKPEQDFEKQVASFLRVTQYLHTINTQLGLSMDTLSMGMSHDFAAAIRAGSTIVRIGTAIFGEREVR